MLRLRFKALKGLGQLVQGGNPPHSLSHGALLRLHAPGWGFRPARAPKRGPRPRPVRPQWRRQRQPFDNFDTWERRRAEGPASWPAGLALLLLRQGWGWAVGLLEAATESARRAAAPYNVSYGQVDLIVKLVAVLAVVGFIRIVSSLVVGLVVPAALVLAVYALTSGRLPPDWDPRRAGDVPLGGETADLVDVWFEPPGTPGGERLDTAASSWSTPGGARG
mmetsp:Transcript_1308/g.3114  ORF Transcript_1308/g.3114 Transcript_1308/m.3114 type:complete len:221 (+) Transcript_1308:339-1001(+)